MASQSQSKYPEPGFIWPYVNPPLYEPFWFEKFDVVRCRDWMERNWSISIYICVVYTLIVIIGKQLMKHRSAFDLKTPLALWNLSMAVFSAVGLLRCWPELRHVLQGEHGFYRSICVRDSHTQAAAYWAWLFTLSKIVELGDTCFIILRKKELMFVHYYHHSVALIICFAYYSDYEPIARWFGIANFAVHTILYFYLFLKTMDVQLPRILAKVIIICELGQMILGLAVNSYALSMRAQGISCERNMKAIRVQMALYASFVVIFVYLFIESSRKKDKIQSKKTT